MKATITDQWDEEGKAAGVIRVTYAEGGTTDYPYDDSAERVDQLLNARSYLRGFDVADLSDTFITKEQ